MRRHLESALSPHLQLREIEDPTLDTLLASPMAAGAGLASRSCERDSASEGVPEHGSIELWRFYVDKSWHGQGVARGAHGRRSKRSARVAARATLWLGVWERNARAQAFYRKYGFGKVGTQVFVVGSDPQTDDVMLCNLQ